VKKKILIVDDNIAIVEVLSHFLDSQGFAIKGAYRGDDGLALATEFIPDLILLDVLMPGMTGYEVCASLKKDDKLKKIPVIFITVEGTANDISLGYSLGAADYIIKPFDLTDLYGRITSVLERITHHR